MNWCYRVMRRKFKDSTYEFGIYEHYMDENDEIGWTKEPIKASAETLYDLMNALRDFPSALSKPVLDWKTGKPITNVSPEGQE